MKKVERGLRHEVESDGWWALKGAVGGFPELEMERVREEVRKGTVQSDAGIGDRRKEEG